MNQENRSHPHRVKRWIKGLARFLLALILIFVVALAGWWWVQPALPTAAIDVQQEYVSPATPTQVVDASREMILDVAAELHLPSISVAVGVDGKVAWAAAAGFADLSSGRGADLQTQYRTGSVAKSITGYAASRLASEGKLDLDSSVHAYVDGFPKKRWDVTLRQLSSHTGGIRHYADPGQPGFMEEQFSKHHYASVDEALNLFKNDPLVYQPGTDFRYSTHSYTLLSAAMESAAEKPFPDLMRDLVWDPLGMTDTSIDDLTASRPNRAIPYLAIAGRAFHVEGPDPSYKWAGGGLLSTPSDLVRLAAAMLQERRAAEANGDDRFTSRPLADGSENPQRYTLGWRNETQTELVGSTEPLLIMTHGGQCPGGSSFILLIPDEAIAAAVMTNVSIANPWPMREALYRIAAEYR